MTTRTTTALSFRCETCGAAAFKKCVTRDGTERKSVHTARRELATLAKARFAADESERRTSITTRGPGDKREVHESPCTHCGVAVLWIPSVPGWGSGWHPPHEELPEERVLIHGEIRTFPVLVRHACGEDRIERYATERAEKARLFREEREAARQSSLGRKSLEVAASIGDAQARGEANAAAIGVDCTKCGVKAGDRCENLLERKKDVVRKTSWPHAERLAAVGWDGTLS